MVNTIAVFQIESCFGFDSPFNTFYTCLCVMNTGNLSAPINIRPICKNVFLPVVVLPLHIPQSCFLGRRLRLSFWWTNEDVGGDCE